MDQVTRLREYLGEQIPEDGSAADTMFSDESIQDILLAAPPINSPDNPNAYLQLAAAEGWERKAAIYSNQVDHEQGGAKDALSQLRQNAISQADRYRSLAYGRRTSRIGRIVRPGTTVT